MVYKVAIIGAGSSVSSWAAKSHIPAFKALDKAYKIVGVLNSSVESGKKGIEYFGLDKDVKAYANLEEVAEDGNVDIVVVTVKVPQHYKLAEPLIKAKKIVYVEWPLGNGLEETIKLAELAGQNNVKTIVGSQSRFDPVLVKAKEYIGNGTIGEVTSFTFTGATPYWGLTEPEIQAEYLDKIENGAHLLTIPVGHSLDAIRFVLGQNISSVKATVQTRFKEVSVANGDGKIIGTREKTAPDHVFITGTFGADSVFSYSVSGGQPNKLSPALKWSIRGTKGDILIEGPNIFTEFIPLKVSVITNGKDEVTEFNVPGYNAVVGNIKNLWESFAKGDQVVDFASAVELYKVVDAVQRSSDTGKEIVLSK